MLEYNWGSSSNNIPLEWLSVNGNLYSVKALCIFCQNFKLNCWFCHSFPRCKCSMCKEMDNPLLCYVKLVFLWSFQNHKNCSKCVNLQVAIDFDGSSPATVLQIPNLFSLDSLTHSLSDDNNNEAGRTIDLYILLLEVLKLPWQQLQNKSAVFDDEIAHIICATYP